MSNNEVRTSQVAIPLPSGKKVAVQIGGICLMLSISMFGLSLNVLNGPILLKMDAMQYFSLITICLSLGGVIMNPIGGKLGDLFGRRNVVIISGIISAICGVGLSLAQSIIPYAILVLLLGASQGAFTAAPYIIAREVNEPKDVPKAMGILSSCIAIGGFGGSILAGFLADSGQIALAILFPIIPLVIGVLLIAVNLPNKKIEGKVKIDIPGIIILATLMTAFFLSMNFGGKVGWGDPFIIGGFVLTAVLLFIFVKVENKASEPVIPMHLFKNKQYVSILVLGILAMYYLSSMNAYSPLAVQQVLGASATASGSLQLPRTIIIIILPTFVGIWIGKNKGNYWKAMAIAMATIIICFLPLSFMNPSTPVAFFIGALAFTGISETCRAVSITPYAQTTLSPKDLGIGTSLVTFFNSMASLIAAAVNGLIFDSGVGSVNKAINQIFMSSALAGFIGLLLVFFVIRKQIAKSDNGQKGSKVTS